MGGVRSPEGEEQGRSRGRGVPVPVDHAGKSGLAFEGLAAPADLGQFLDSDGEFGGRYWDRTSDPSRVKGVLSR